MTGFMEPGEVHKVVAKRKPSYFVGLFIEPKVFQEFAVDHGIAAVPHFAVDEILDPLLLRDLEEFSASMTNGTEILKLESQLAALMHQALHYTEVRPQRCRITQPGLLRSLETAREMLRERYNETVTLKELAAACALSGFHLVRSFTARYGLPPHAYQVQMRIKHACRMLRSGLTCAETAFAAGFADQSHLTRHFKGIMGVTPRHYAQGAVSRSEVSDECVAAGRAFAQVRGA